MVINSYYKKKSIKVGMFFYKYPVSIRTTCCSNIINLNLKLSER